MQETPEVESTRCGRVHGIEFCVVQRFQGPEHWSIHDKHAAVVSNGLVSILLTQSQAAVSDRWHWGSAGGFTLLCHLDGINHNGFVELNTASPCLGVMNEKGRHFGRVILEFFCTSSGSGGVKGDGCS